MVMANAKKVAAPQTILRAPDGSAYIECDACGKSVSCALLKSHGCDKGGASEACINSLVQTQETEVAVSTGKRKSVGDEPKKKKASTEKTEKTEKASKEEKAEKGPKQPLSAYLRFSQDKRASFKEENPTADSKEIMKGLGAMWKEMSEEEKKPYEEAAKAEMAKFLEEHGPIIRKKKEAAPKKEKKEKKEKEKKPVSGYICFSSHSREEVKKENPEMKVTEIMRILGAKWKELSATEKEEWNAKAKAEFEAKQSAAAAVEGDGDAEEEEEAEDAEDEE